MNAAIEITSMTKKSIYHFINDNKVFVNLIYILIVVNVLAIILESYKEIRLEYGTLLYVIEVVSVIIFTIEYILRFWTYDQTPGLEGSAIRKRFKFATSKFGIIDLAAIVPFYLPLVMVLDLRVIRILRLLRLIRIFKLGRLSESMKTIGGILKDSKADLAVTVFVAFILLVLSSTMMYYFEADAQPDKFPNIGQALWWSVATLTTVGYGDVYPVTGVGKVLSGVVALIGIGFVALPTSILSSAFVERLRKNRKKKKEEGMTCSCPNCGTTFEPAKSNH